MVKKSDAPDSIPLTLNTDFLPRGYLNMPYDEQLAKSGGQGDIMWTVTSGVLPEGLTLNDKGHLAGNPHESGDFNFRIKISDDFGNSDSTDFSLHINSEYYSLLKLSHLDTAFVMNTGEHVLPVYDFVEGTFDTANYALNVASTFPEGIIQTGPLTMISQDSFNLELNTVLDESGDTQIFLILVDKHNPNPLDNSNSSPVLVKILPFINEAPQCNPIPDTTTGLNVNYVKHYIHLSGINDGNDGSQNISIEMTIDNPDILRYPRLTYSHSEDSAVFTFYPWKLGIAHVTLLIKDDGGTDLGGVDSLIVAFTININETNGTGDVSVEHGFGIYPNPADNELFVSLPDESGKARIYIYNLNGKAVLISEITGNERLDLESLNEGYYLIKVVTDKNTFRSSLVINR